MRSAPAGKPPRASSDMKINSRPSNLNPAQTGADQPTSAKKAQSFELGGADASKALQSVGSRFKASDLDKPGTADQAVRESFSAMLEDQPVSGALPGER